MVAAVAFDTPDVAPRIVRSHEFQDRLRNQPVGHDAVRTLDVGPFAAGVEVDLRAVGQLHLVTRGHALFHHRGGHLDVAEIFVDQRTRRIGQFVHPDRNFITVREYRRRKKPRSQQGNPEFFHCFFVFIHSGSCKSRATNVTMPSCNYRTSRMAPSIPDRRYFLNFYKNL